MLDGITAKTNIDDQDIDKHILDLLDILDMKILRILLKIQNICIESSNRGFSMSFIEIFNLFSNNGELNNSEELQQLKNGYISREMVSKNKGYKNNLDILFEKFSLSWLERQIFIMSLAAELHPKYERVFGLIADDISIKYPTLETVFKILFDDSKEYIKYKKEWIAGGILQKSLLFDSPWSQYSQNNEIRLDSRIVYYVMGIERYPKELENYMKIYYPDLVLPPVLIKKDLQKNLRSHYTDGLYNRKTVLINLEGSDGMGRTFQLRHLCKNINKTLLILDMKLFLDDKNMEKLIRYLLCEKILQDSVLAIRLPNNFEEKIISAVIHLKNEFIKNFPCSEILYIISNDSLNKYQIGQNSKLIHYLLELPTEYERKIVWEEMSKQFRFNTKINWGEFASKFRFTPGQIKNTLELSNITKNKRNTSEIDLDNLISACYQNGKTYLITKARKIEAKFKWDDIILPMDSKNLLRDACNQMKYRQIVFGDWGFEKKLSYGKGLSILFSGPPGTGKTMSAQVVANELKLELYKVDIANLVSKYIGETEKNLEGIFDEASLSNAILFFDEADAIFGKRTEVKDSHDRHANVETAYLLQRIEDYEGVTILASNYLKNIDEAFLRRFNFVIEFPFPDVKYREMIWRTMFPKETPLQEDTDFSLIAKKFEISGGNIKNIVLASAFIAAEANESVGTCHIIKAARNELNKIGKMVVLDDIEEYL